MSARANTTIEDAKAQIVPIANNGMVPGHEGTVISRFLNDENALDQYPDLQPKHFGDPVKREIFKGIRRLSDDGYPVNFMAVEDYFRRRGQLEKIGKHTLTNLAADNRVTAMDNNCFDYALDCVMDAYREREAMRVFRDAAAGKIGVEKAHKELDKILSKSAPRGETKWLTTIDAATVCSSELASLTLKPRAPLLSNWLCEGDYGIIYARRGVGKTWLGQLIAKAVSIGGRVGEWEAPRPAKVLYVDGEMPPDLMRDRDKGLGSGEVEYLNHSILFDRTERVLNITESAVQEAILQRCIRDNIRLVILDNLSTLASGVKENDSFDWEPVHNWLLDFRRRKIAVILIHHAGRSGEIRGTTKREDAAFWIIALDDAKEHSDDKRGARFVSRFTKPSRNTQDEVPPFEWHIVTDTATGEVSIACKPAQTMDVLRRWIEDGVTECGQLAQEMRVTPGTISKWAKKAMNEGWLKKKGREYVLVEGNRETSFRVVDGGNEGNGGKRK
jgi:hypothetical protein